VSSPYLPGAEPFSAEGGPSGVLLLHGFTGNPFAIRPLAQRLAAAGLTVEAPALPGHGTVVEDLVPLRWQDWAAAAEQEFTSLASRCDRLAVVGHSMGGTLACFLAERHPEVRGIAVVNPLVEPPADDLRVGIRQLLDRGITVLDGTGPDIADTSVEVPTYSGAPLAALLSLFDAVEEVALGLGSIQCPVLVITSRVDHVIPPTNGDFLEASVSGPVERVWLEHSYHAALLDFDHEEVEDRVSRFVVTVTAGEEAGRP
jgi:carboxylesterase